MLSAVSHPCFYHATLNITLKDGSRVVRERLGNITFPTGGTENEILTLEVMVVEEDGYCRLNEENIVDVFLDNGVDISLERVQIYRINLVTNAISDGNSVNDLMV